MSFKKILIILVMANLAFVSCSHDDQVFDETPQARKDAQVMELEDAISESSTFKGVYFPNPELYGGSLIYFDFIDEDKVKMSSGFDEDTKITESTYDIRFNSSVELNFETFNHISKLAQNDLPGLRGTGFEGSNNFIFVGKDDNGGIILKDPRNGTFFELNPIPQEEFNTSESKTENIFNNSGFLASPTGSVFQALVFDSGNGTENYDLDYDPNRLHGSALKRGEDGAVEDEIDFGVAFTSEGLTVNPEIKNGENIFKDFVYDASEDVFISSSGGVQARLGSAGEPAYIPDDYLTLFEGNGNTLHVSWRPNSYGTSDFTTQAYLNNFVGAAQEFSANAGGRVFDYWQLNIDDFDDNQFGARLDIRYISGSTAFHAYFNLGVHVVDNKVFFTYTGTNDTNTNSSLWEDEMMPMIDFFTGDKGFIIRSRGSFSASNASYTNPSITMTNLNDPSERVYCIVYPQ